ncbi:MAG: fumarate hydratase [Lachnospiraceae bacterium]|nr:fumarate hydratase [Lachnospiraceae bacterium]
MREIECSKITEAVKGLCLAANTVLGADVENAIRTAEKEETSPLGKKVLGQLTANLDIAKNELIPICQDTGMAILFVKVGQEVHITGGNLTDAINQGVREGYTEGYLRKSVVSDPLLRVNTGDNTPAIIHYDIVPGDKLDIMLAPKGFGSENKSKLYMLTPADGREGVKKAVIDAVTTAGPNACPPMVVGVGIGGDFEKCAILAKTALTRDITTFSEKEHIKELEIELTKELNELGIGPGGMGGVTTVLGVNIETYPTHIAGLPVAVNICCHVNRHKSISL